MKKILVGFLCIMCQCSRAQIRAGITSGYTRANMRAYGETPLNDYGIRGSALGTFHAGVQANISLGKKISLQPSLLYFNTGTRKTGRGIYPNYIYDDDTKIKIASLRLPVNIVYKIKVGPQLNMVAGAGLYVSKGLSASEKGFLSSGTAGGVVKYSIDKKLEFSNDDPNLAQQNTVVKPYEFGHTILLGAEWQHIFLSANLSNSISKTYTTVGYNYKSIALALSLCYLVAL